MSMLQEFKKFALRGNVLDLAIGVIIGGAFGKIVTSFINDVIMPPIGLLLGKVNFADLFIPLTKQDFTSLTAAREAGAPVIAYGAFLNTVLDFLVVMLVLFLLLRQINKWFPKPEPAPAPATKTCPYCLTEVPEKATRCPACTSEL